MTREKTTVELPARLGTYAYENNRAKLPGFLELAGFGLGVYLLGQLIKSFLPKKENPSDGTFNPTSDRNIVYRFVNAVAAPEGETIGTAAYARFNGNPALFANSGFTRRQDPKGQVFIVEESRVNANVARLTAQIIGNQTQRFNPPLQAPQGWQAWRQV
jgi:hypothetical protein